MEANDPKALALENISGANDPKALPSENIFGANDPKAPPLENILEANDPQALPLENILGAPCGHAPPFLVRIVWGRMQYAPTLPADSGDLHSFALVGNHFMGG